MFDSPVKDSTVLGWPFIVKTGSVLWAVFAAPAPDPAAPGSHSWLFQNVGQRVISLSDI